MTNRASGPVRFRFERIISMLRRDGILFRRGVIPALVLSVLLAAAAAGAGFSVLKSAGEGAPRAELVVVDEENSLYSRIAISTVEGQSYIQSILSVDTERKEERALERLEAGECAAVIVLPKGYVNAIMVGHEAKGRIILSEAAAASADIVASVALFGERLLAAGQYGVFAGQELIWKYGLGAKFEQDYLLKSNTGLLNAALSLFDEAFTVEIMPYDGTSLPLAGYYASAWLVLFFMLCGLFFTGLYLTDNKPAMLTRLYALGVTPAGFYLAKWLLPLCFRLLLGAGILFGLSRFMPLTLSPLSLLLFLLGTAFISHFVSAVCVISADRSAGFGIVTALAAAGLFLMGGLVPRSMLGRTLVGIGHFTPSGLAASFFAPLFGGKADWLCAGLAVLLAAGLQFWTLRALSLRPIWEGGDEQ